MNHIKHLIFWGIIFLLFSCNKEETIFSDLENGLVAYYPFDGDATDKSHNANHGITQKTTYQEGRFGDADGSLFFDGDSTTFYALHQEQLDFQNEFTIALWVKALSNDPPSADFIISKGFFTPYYRQPPFQISMPDETIYRFEAQSEERITDVDAQKQTVDTWEHLTAVFYNQILSIYINGELILTRTLRDRNLRTNTEPLTIGSLTDFDSDGKIITSNRFKGNIDEVRIYKRALNFVEIKELQKL